VREFFIIFTALGGCGIGYIYPFVVVFRGGTLNGLIGPIWGLLVLYFVCLCFGIPAIVSLFDPKFSDEIRGNWVPEESILVGIGSLGWTIPLIGGAVGMLIRRVSLALFPAWMNRISIHQP